jgi:hypothetical protein
MRMSRNTILAMVCCSAMSLVGAFSFSFQHENFTVRSFRETVRLHRTQEASGGGNTCCLRHRLFAAVSNDVWIAHGLSNAGNFLLLLMRCSRDVRERKRFARCRPNLQPHEFEGAASLICVSTLSPETILLLTVLTFQLSFSSLHSTLRPAAMTSLFLIAGWILTFEPAVVHSAVQVGVYNLRYV